MKNNIEKLIGNTPIIKINYEYQNRRRFAYFKAEWLNFSGSIKDRVAYQIILDALKFKKLKHGQEIVEVTSGNMGLSLSAVAKSFGFKTTIFMPRGMSEERKKLLKMYGAKLILTSSFEKAFEMAKKYAKENNAFLASQFSNKSNITAQMKTSKEIYLKLKGKLKAFIAGMGTSGTLMGAVKYFRGKAFLKDAKKLKVKPKAIKIFGLEPFSSQVFSRGVALGEHKIQGLADDFVPELYSSKNVDKIIQINDQDAIAMSDKLCKTFGFAVGISSGANFLGAVLTSLNGVASVFADDNKKYLSTELFGAKQTDLTNQIKLKSFEIL